MTTLDVGAAPAVLSSQRPSRARIIVVVAVTITALTAFLGFAQHVLTGGYLRRDIAALMAGEAWRTGGWLSQMLLSFVSVLPNVAAQQEVLTLAAAAMMGLLFGLLYYRLRGGGWTVGGALLLLLALGSHALVLYSVSAASRSIPLFFAMAAMIPAIRQVETVGDVQSAIALGLVMPLLLLAGPSVAPLILLFAIAGALADPDGRRDPRAFFAMLLVAILPSLIIAIGILGFAAQAGMDLVDVLLPYLPAYGSVGLGDWAGALARLLLYAPVMVVPMIYCFQPGQSEGHRWSAIAVVLLPAYLAIGNVTFPWNLPPHAASVALLATFASWLSVVRLSFPLRAAAVVLLLASVATSWTQHSYWDDVDWRTAIAHEQPLDLAPR